MNGVDEIKRLTKDFGPQMNGTWLSEPLVMKSNISLN